MNSLLRPRIRALPKAVCIGIPNRSRRPPVEHLLASSFINGLLNQIGPDASYRMRSEPTFNALVRVLEQMYLKLLEKDCSSCAMRRQEQAYAEMEFMRNQAWGLLRQHGLDT